MRGASGYGRAPDAVPGGPAGRLRRNRTRSSPTAADPRAESRKTTSNSTPGGGSVCSSSVERQVKPCELQGQGGGDGGGQQRVGEGGGPGPGSQGNGELRGAQGEEGRALPGPPGCVTPQDDAESDGGDHEADSDDPLPQSGAEHAFGGRPGRAGHGARAGRRGPPGGARAGRGGRGGPRE